MSSKPSPSEFERRKREQQGMQLHEQIVSAYPLALVDRPHLIVCVAVCHRRARDQRLFAWDAIRHVDERVPVLLHDVRVAVVALTVQGFPVDSRIATTASSSRSSGTGRTRIGSSGWT
jgi:hypothetical protein